MRKSLKYTGGEHFMMKIAILGLGTVGGGVLNLLQKVNGSRTDSKIEITYVLAREIKDESLDLTGIKVTDDIDEILNSDVQLIVEVLGGVEFPYEVQRKALERGIHVVTANKDLLALYLNELAQIANQHQAQIGYEASCGGGIPIIQPLQYSLNANKINKVMGILNGTTNYILTKMADEQCEYQEALDQAQALGYAEKDPTNDVEGYDTARKIAILSRLAFQVNVPFERIEVRGISQVDQQDIQLAKENGFTLKLLGKSRQVDDAMSISVEPVLLPNRHSLSNVKLEKNAIFVDGDAVGQTMFYGPGAGSSETASAVVSDILFIERFGFTGNLTTEESGHLTKSLTDHRYYIRLDDDIAPLQARLAATKTNYQLWQNDQTTAILTANISDAQFKELTQDLPIAAYYQIEGE